MPALECCEPRRQNPERTPADWGETYRRTHTTYVDLAPRLETLIRDLLKQHGIEVVQVESRAKSVESFVDKISRKKAQYSDPLKEITDLIGVRVITYYAEDVDKIAAILEKELDIDQENSIDKSRALRPDEFGYTGVHYIASLGSTRRDLPEWASFRGKCVEIQLRTAAQHAWAAVDHKLNYKSPHEIPDQLRRRFFRISAIFELADDQFSQLRHDHQMLEEKYASSVRGGNLDIAVDSASLDAYLEETSRIAPILQAARDLGWAIPDAAEDPDRAARDRRDLARVLDMLKIATIGQFDEILADVEAARSALEHLTAVIQPSSFFMAGLPDDMLCLLLLTRFEAPVEQISEIYADGFAQLVAIAQAST